MQDPAKLLYTAGSMLSKARPQLEVYHKWPFEKPSLASIKSKPRGQETVILGRRPDSNVSQDDQIYNQNACTYTSQLLHLCLTS